MSSRRPSRHLVGILVLLLAAPRLSAEGSPLNLDIGAGVLIDAAPWGIEYAAPEAAVALWRDGSLRPGAMVEASWLDSRGALSAVACLGAGTESLSGFGGAGIALYFDPALSATPFFEAGLRVAGNRFFMMPIAALRFKQRDSDSEIRLLFGMTF